MLSSHVELTQATQQQQRLLPENFTGLVRRLGQELSCAIWYDIVEGCVRGRANSPSLVGSLGVLREPVLTPCYHAFCRECIDQMLRVAQKTDAPCPICKGRLTRRSLLAAGAWDGLVQTFSRLAAALEAETGRKWDDPDEIQDGAPSSDIATTQVRGDGDP